jgi:hypothetical protein
MSRMERNAGLCTSVAEQKSTLSHLLDAVAYLHGRNMVRQPASGVARSAVQIAACAAPVAEAAPGMWSDFHRSQHCYKKCMSEGAKWLDCKAVLMGVCDHAGSSRHTAWESGVVGRCIAVAAVSQRGVGSQGQRCTSVLPLFPALCGS